MKDLFLQKEFKKPVEKELYKLVQRVEKLKNALVELEEKTEETIEEEIITDNLVEEPIKEAIITQEEPDYIVLESPKQKQQVSIAALEQEAIATVTKNKKTIIKQKIIGVANKNRVTAKQLKEIVVDKHTYCSKATFYRYLTELRKERRLEAIQINNKEYLYGIQKEYNI
ncbi:hypothetical protein K9M74_02265 [Candidatus Woesearchaeota archaeon]|nr:hypothetical protein [Candidatus Woesearchaeota archaeon]